MKDLPEKLELVLASATWRKSKRSGEAGNCVEVALAREVVGVRDSKAPDGGRLVFAPDAWRAFVESIKQGKFDQA